MNELLKHFLTVLDIGKEEIEWVKSESGIMIKNSGYSEKEAVKLCLMELIGGK